VNLDQVVSDTVKVEIVNHLMVE